MNDIDRQHEKRAAIVHYTVACIGGFLGLFPIVNAAQAFGSAQTMNLIEAVLLVLRGNGQTAALHLSGAAVYALAVVLSTVLAKRTKLNIQLLALAVDALAALIMWRFPIDAALPLVVYLYPTFFAMPFQWCAFKGAYGFASSTIFSSNNFRQFISALAEVSINRDKSFALKARFFGLTLAGFHIGVLAGGIAWYALGNTGFLFALMPIAVATTLVVRK